MSARKRPRTSAASVRACSFGAAISVMLRLVSELRQASRSGYRLQRFSKIASLSKIYFKERTMAKSMKPTLSHMGIFVTDMELMVRFYTEVLGLTVTDHGQGVTFKNELTFL